MSKFTDLLGCVRDLGVDTMELYHHMCFDNQLYEFDYELFICGLRNFLKAWDNVPFNEIVEK